MATRIRPGFPRHKPLPPKPGGPKATRREAAAEAGITAVDWVDERLSLAGGVRWFLWRKVPKGTNWFYTLGSGTLFAFL